MILIIQTGDPVTVAKTKFGTFDQWFTQGMNVTPSQVSVVNVHRQQALPEVATAIEAITGIIITGSPAMVTDRDEWLIETQRWLEKLIPHNIPILGVCFGHQLLADLLGGQVDYNKRGRNLGLSQLCFEPAAQEDQLFAQLYPQKSIPTFVSHLQHVTRLPPSATSLATAEIDPNHAFSVGQHIWGVQFHPEWNVAITRMYIEARKADLLNEGFNPKKMIQQLQPCPEAYGLLARFKLITER